MARPAEIVEGAAAQQLIAIREEIFQVTGEGGGVTAHVDDFRG